MNRHIRVFLGLVVGYTLCMAASGEDAGASDTERNDPLVYDSAAQCRKVWRPALGADRSDVLIPTDSGLTLDNIEGDVWRNRDDARAVYLRGSARPVNVAVEVGVSGFVPQDRFAQVGLVAWRDADNYVRNTVGFQPAGVECVGEFRQEVRTGGIHVLYPRTHPMSARLRLEIGRRSVCAMVAGDHGFWQVIDTAILPEHARAGAFFRGVGLIGVGGAMQERPVFADWCESALPSFKQDEFDENLRNWRKCVLSSGWGAGEKAIEVHDGHLCVQPAPGADIFMDNLNYACAMQPAPCGEAWQLTTKLSQFDGTTPGRFRKAGIVLFQGRGRWLAVTVVSDDHFGHMYAEQLTQGAIGTGWRICSKLHGSRRVSDAYLRVTKTSPGRFEGAVSFDGAQWTTLDAVEIALDEPRVQLFAGGDVERMHPDVNWTARFDYVRTGTAATAVKEGSR